MYNMYKIPLLRNWCIKQFLSVRVRNCLLHGLSQSTQPLVMLESLKCSVFEYLLIVLVKHGFRSLFKPHDSLIEKMADQEKKILDELTWPLRLMLLKDIGKSKPTTEQTRRVGMQALMQHRRADIAPENDESNMKMKLFRLMYETVRENDLKTKRAELIKVHYSNSTSFEIGYLMGDVSDKYNVMSDIALTLKRLYNDWKPLEHINAYEQIANQAIEISHIIEMINAAANRDASTQRGDTETTTIESTTLPTVEHKVL